MSSTLASVDRALQIVEELRRDGALRLSDLAERLRVSPSTVHRLLTTLRTHRFVVQLPSRRYDLGPAMLFTAGTSMLEHCVQMATPTMKRLRERTGETIHLAVLRGAAVTFVAAAEGDRMVRVSSRVGWRPGAHVTAAGKVLLASLEDGQLLELYADRSFEQAPHTVITSHRDLWKAVATTRARGYARNLGESEDDMYAIAVPVRREGGTGAVVASLSVAAPLGRVAYALEGTAPGLTGMEQRLLDSLLRAAREIEENLVL